MTMRQGKRRRLDNRCSQTFGQTLPQNGLPLVRPEALNSHGIRSHIVIDKLHSLRCRQPESGVSIEFNEAIT